MSFLQEIREAGVAGIATTLGYQVVGRGPQVVTPCPACHLAVRSTGATSGRPDRRQPVRISRDGLLWHCHAGACQAGGSAVDFASHALFGERLGRGDGRWCELRARLETAPLLPPRRSQLSACAAPADYPPLSDVQGLWDAARSVVGDAAASSWAATRAGVNLQRLELLDVARVLPSSAPCPIWARQGGRAWTRTGHRLLAPLVDARGDLRSVRARLLASGPRKELAPTGHDVGGLVAACPMARVLLAAGTAAAARNPEHVREAGLVIVEGTPAWWGWLSAFSDADERAPAIIGIASGGWTQAHADAVAAAASDGVLRILLDVDPDPGGERLARQVISTFLSHLRVGRVRLERRARAVS